MKDTSLKKNRNEYWAGRTSICHQRIRETRMGNFHIFGFFHSKSVLLHILYIFHRQHGADLEGTRIFECDNHRQKFTHKIDRFSWSNPKINPLCKQRIAHYCNRGILVGKHTSLRMLRRPNFKDRPNIV